MRTQIVVDESDMRLSFAPNDRIFLGEGLFETLRVERSKPCFARLHWQRLKNSALVLGIPFDLSLDHWIASLINQIKRNQLIQGGVKAILSGGVAARGLAERGLTSQLIFQTFKYSRENQPVRLMSVPWLRDSSNPIYQIKSVNYLEAIIARRHAVAMGFDDALFFNMQQHVTETTCANLFIIKNNGLITPPVADGVLPGITRSKVQMLCKRLQMDCSESSISKDSLLHADAVILTNVLQGIRYVGSIDHIQLKQSHPLIEQLNLSLLEEFEQQIE